MKAVGLYSKSDLTKTISCFKNSGRNNDIFTKHNRDYSKWTLPPNTWHSTTERTKILRMYLNKADVQTSIAELAGPLNIKEIIDTQQADITLRRFRDNSANEEAISSILRTLHRRIEDIFEDNGVSYIIDHDVCKSNYLVVYVHSILKFLLTKQPRIFLKSTYYNYNYNKHSLKLLLILMYFPRYYNVIP